LALWSSILPRLLIVTTVQSTLEGFLMPYAEHFRAKGWTVDALAKGATESQACRQGFDHCFEADWSRSPLQRKGIFCAPAALRALVAAGSYDVVHVHTPVAAFLTRFALRRLRAELGFKVVYTAHGFHFHEGRGFLGNALFAAAERLVGRWTDRLVVINHTDEQAALRLGIVDATRLRYMPGIGLDLQLFDPSSTSLEEVEAVRQELGLHPGQPLFLMVAEFNPGKRHRDLLVAFAALPEPTAHLAFAGTGVEMEALRQWCVHRGLAGRVHFLGQRTDIKALLRASLAMVLPSEREGLPRSVMEAMAMGVPVIGSTARGVQDLLDDCGGLKVPVGDTKALMEAMWSFIRDPEAARRMGEEARGRMDKYQISNLLRLHEDLYVELLKEGEIHP
jgi:glycosyltransferase involved in cell wall biosynthesis